MTAPKADHLQRLDYDSELQALVDARRVMQDLADLVESHTVVPSDRLEFLTRRAIALVSACVQARTAPPGGAS